MFREWAGCMHICFFTWSFPLLTTVLYSIMLVSIAHEEVRQPGKVGGMHSTEEYMPLVSTNR